jgi:osmotically-inducible protein OsmY
MRRFLVGVISSALLTLALGCHNGDADLNRRVQVRLAKEPTPSEQLTVTTHERVVRLKGVVHSSAERERLERAAREVDGVASVENELVIDAPVELTGSSSYTKSSMYNPADALLQEKIRHRLDAQALDDIAVDVKDGVVTYTGKVPQDVHDAAIQIAIDAHADVDDRMTIAKP